jgi:riboflavin kinase/FMN adenylyltransferase
VLVTALRAKVIVVGRDFHFGHNRTGHVDMLEKFGRTHDFEVRPIELVVRADGVDEPVSSTAIRRALAGGDVTRAAQMLGRPYEIRGTVVMGDQRGRTLGFPTANLLPRDGYVVPGHGVYACRATTADGVVHVAATNVGVRPMFVTGRGELIEAFLVDFQGDIYGTELRVEFLKRLRGEKRFESVDALIEQMGRDVEEARAIAA